MKMKTIGYFDGTDSVLLTKLTTLGHGTIPLANDYDRAGKMANQLEPGEIDLIIGYLHKLIPPIKKDTGSKPTHMREYRGMKPIDLLYPAKAYDIPVIIIVPKGHHKEAKELLGEAADFVEIVSPEELEETVLKFL